MTGRHLNNLWLCFKHSLFALAVQLKKYLFNLLCNWTYGVNMICPNNELALPTFSPYYLWIIKKIPSNWFDINLVKESLTSAVHVCLTKLSSVRFFPTEFLTPPPSKVSESVYLKALSLDELHCWSVTSPALAISHHWSHTVLSIPFSLYGSPLLEVFEAQVSKAEELQQSKSHWYNNISIWTLHFIKAIGTTTSVLERYISWKSFLCWAQYTQTLEAWALDMYVIFLFFGIFGVE